MVVITIEGSRKLKRAPDLPYTISLPDPNVSTIEDVKKLLALKFPKFPVERQRLTLPPPTTSEDSSGKLAKGRAPKDEETLAQAGLENGGTLHIKDLGPQASWTVVFVTEYAGPLLIHLLVYNYFPWNVPFKRSKMQTFAYWMFVLHFVKRELETLFLHRFSHSTMPFMYIFRNSAHYWFLAGLMSAVSIYGPWNSLLRLEGTIREQDWFLWACTGAWLFFELLNFSTHLTLRRLRPAGSRKRAIPQGILFKTVSFPNYTTEILGWVCVCIMTGDMWCIIYVLVGTATMVKWALDKQKRYLKEFGAAYPRERKAIFPFVL